MSRPFSSPESMCLRELMGVIFGLYEQFQSRIGKKLQNFPTWLRVLKTCARKYTTFRFSNKTDSEKNLDQLFVSLFLPDEISKILDSGEEVVCFFSTKLNEYTLPFFEELRSI